MEASPGLIDEIWIAGGTYFPDDGAAQTPGDRASTFNLPSDVTLRGGFQGTETEFSQRNPEAFPTVLSGDLDQDDTDPDGDGIIESPSDVSGVNARHVVTVQGSWVRLDHLVITAGNADGAAADSQGGGALVNDGGSVLRNCRFVGNAATGDGGAIHGFDSTLDIEDCQLVGNSAGDDGGAIYAWVCTCQVRRTRISGNSATDRAGGLYLTDTSGYVADSLLTGNVASNSGGAIYIKKGATFGVYGCTIADNYAAGRGGGLFMEVGGDGVPTPTVTIESSVLWGNSTADGTTAESASANLTDDGVDVAYHVANLVQVGGGLPDDYPQFVEPTVAPTTPDTGGDYHLSATSPLIDAGGYRFPRTLDLDRNRRVYDFRQDLGAYETVVLSEQTFADRYPDLPRNGDANGNGLSNLLDYESGSDPQAPPSGRPALAVWNLGGSAVLDYYEHRNRGARLVLEVAHDLGGPWLRVADILESGTDYRFGVSSVDGVPLPDRDPTKDEFARRQTYQILTGNQLYFRLRAE